MKLPTPGSLKSNFVSVIMALVLLNMVMAGGTGLILALLRVEWGFVVALAPILVPIAIGIGIGIVLKLFFAFWRSQSWRWRR